MKKTLLLFLLFCTHFVIAKPLEIPADIDSAKITYFYFKQTIDLKKVENPELYFEIYRWIGNPYLLGGSSAKGIDCSNFVRMLFSKVYKKNIEGNAITFFPQCSTHQFVDMSAEGDLIFFKINNSEITHVAIYLQHGKFAHVTVHGGVMVSDVEDPYWSKYFYKCARPQEALSYGH